VLSWSDGVMLLGSLCGWLPDLVLAVACCLLRSPVAECRAETLAVLALEDDTAATPRVDPGPWAESFNEMFALVAGEFAQAQSRWRARGYLLGCCLKASGRTAGRSRSSPGMRCV